jgi:hypothetical protein
MPGHGPLMGSELKEGQEANKNIHDMFGFALHITE